MPARRIVAVSYFYPPSPTVGGHRWASMARHLSALGHDVTVVTTRAMGAQAGEDANVVRTGDLAASKLLRAGLRREALDDRGAVAAADGPPPTLLTRVVVPDSHLVSWVPWAWRAVRAEIARGAVDCLVTSSPPESTHLLALALGRRRPAWIADLRDGWRFESLHEDWPTRAQRALDARLERRVARSAEVAIAATRPIAEDLRARLGADAHWVTNAWDPLAAPPPGPVVLTDGDAAPTLVHTGKLAGLRGRDPRPLFAALAQLRADGTPLRLVLAGQLDADDSRLLGEARAQLGDTVTHLGLLSRAEALALQREADALLLLTGRQRGVSEATGKLFEYLQAGRPIVALAQGNEAARIVEETAAGVSAPIDDVDAIAGVLRQVADGRLRAAHAPRDLERFVFPAPARDVERLVERAIERRAAA